MLHLAAIIHFYLIQYSKCYDYQNEKKYVFENELQSELLLCINNAMQIR
jgi:hypothetical protein